MRFAPSAWKIALCSESTGRISTPALPRLGDEQVAGADQAFLVGECDPAPARIARKRRREAGRADDAGDDHVDRPGGGLARCALRPAAASMPVPASAALRSP